MRIHIRSIVPQGKIQGWIISSSNYPPLVVPAGTSTRTSRPTISINTYPGTRGVLYIKGG